MFERSWLGWVFNQLQLRQIPQALQIERHQKRLRRHKCMRRPRPRRPGPARDQILVAQPGQQIAADLLAEDIGEAVTVP